MANLVEVIVGTYEEFILGYKVENIREENKIQLVQSFATRSHTASIRCVAAKNKYVMSGGADDRIFVYDMLTRKEVQILHHHEGTVNALAFTPDATHLFTGSDDGKMCAIRLGTWQVEGSWKKAHSGSAVTHISCHPSGKLALTLGNDQTLRTWNLIKGRLAYTTNLKTKPELGRNPDCLAWSPDGDHFTITGLNIVEIWSVKTAGVVKEYKCDSKPTSICWLDEKQLAVGFENGKLWIMDFKTFSQPTINEAHKQRIKAITCMNDILATACSSGEISLWTVKKKIIENITSLNIGCRPTCIALLDLTQFGDDYILKREHDDTDDESLVDDKSIQDTRSKIQSVGNVTVEVEDENEEEDGEDVIPDRNEGKTLKKQKKKEAIETEDVPNKKKDKNKKKETNNDTVSSVGSSSDINTDKKKKRKVASEGNEEDDNSGDDDNVADKKQKKKKSKHRNND